MKQGEVDHKRQQELSERMASIRERSRLRKKRKVRSEAWLGLAHCLLANLAAFTVIGIIAFLIDLFSAPDSPLQLFFVYAICFFSVMQIVFIPFLWMAAKKRGQSPPYFRGLILTAVFLFLINTSCAGLFFYSLSHMYDESPFHPGPGNTPITDVQPTNDVDDGPSQKEEGK